ncbi:MAG TPA: RagB/SusD family nutrient uptake outer membrane protein [Puia sp.]
MKKIIYSLGVMGTVFLGACSKQLDQQPPSTVTTDKFYSNTNDFNQAVTGAYNQLRDYPNQVLWMGEMRSDNINAGSDGNRDWQGINDFSPNLTTTGFIVTAYDNNFNGVYNANSVLDALDKKGGNITDPALRTRFGAEVRFLRAFYYFQLVRLYGQVPIIDHVMSVQEVSKVPRGAVADVYKLIISDLQYAASNLPASYGAADVGRATSYAAKGLLGLVYMTRSGATYPNVNGPGLGLNEWGLAMAQFNDIINSNAFTFGTNYPAIFSYTGENNKEVLFDVQYMTTNNGASYPSMLVPTAYWSGLGLTSYGNGYGSCTFNVSNNLLNSYNNSAGALVDQRDTFNIQFKWNQGTPVVVDSTNPFIKKYINVAKRGADYKDWPINFIVMRYTDILMMKAECILHGASGGTQADVDNIVKMVRQRAGLTALTNVDLPTLMEERRREFVGEGIRWNDLVREGMAVTTMNNWISSDAITTIGQVKAEFTIYPIPNAEILAVPGLYTQNPGYF